MRSSGDDEGTAFLNLSRPSSLDSNDPDTGFMVDNDFHSRHGYSTTRVGRTAAWVASRLRVRRRNFRRHPLQLLFLAFNYSVALLVILVVFTPILAPSYLKPPAHYRELKERCKESSSEPGCANAFKEKVFISVSLYDQHGHLAAGHWGKAVLELIDLIGTDNVFLSIYENNSGPGGAAALMSLKDKVRCPHEFVYDANVPTTDFPHIVMPDGSKRLKRLAYLSEMRNRALRPLDRLEKDGAQYDKILFLNDVAFRPYDAANLLFSTNIGLDGRTQFLSACALDFMHPLLFYDLYAQRDAEGYSNGLPIFPIFSNAGQGLSRADMMAQKDAVRVSSCWGGMVAMQATYVQNLNNALPTKDFQAIGRHVIDPASPSNVTGPVRFRHEPEIFFDACECCLFLADVTRAAHRAQAKEQGVYVNPYIRVAYDWKTLGWLPIVQRWERLFSFPQRMLSPLLRLPTHNPHRTVEEGDGFVEEVWDVAEQKWKLVERVGRSGMFCGVREMQLIMQGNREADKNWVNNQMPPGQTLDFPT